MKDLQSKVEGLSDSLNQATANLVTTQKLLDDTRKELNEKAKVIEELDAKSETPR